MKNKLIEVLAILLWLCIPLWINGQTICSDDEVIKDGYVYEFWADNKESEACMTIEENGKFSANWVFGNTIQFRKGIRPATGSEKLDFNINFYPEGNAWTGAFGKAQRPNASPTDRIAIIFSIIDNWGAWKPIGSSDILGKVFSDGEFYDIYRSERSCRNMPGILGECYYWEYYSVRLTQRNKGTITLSNHIEAWRQLGMEVGNIEEFSFYIETYQSKGSAEVLNMEITSIQTEATPYVIKSTMGDVNVDGLINIIDALIVAQYYVGKRPELFVRKNADVNKDIKIDILDSLLISQCYVGIISCDF